MPNLADLIEEVAEEPVLFAVVGKPTWEEWDSDDPRRERCARLLRLACKGSLGTSFEGYGRMMSWELLRPLLDYEYDNGFGGPDCHPFVAWTASWVIFMKIYDGATYPIRVPREPRDLSPAFIGGW